MTHIYVSKLTIIGSDNGLSPSRRLVIIGTYDGIMLVRNWWTNFSEILRDSCIVIQENSFEYIVCELSAILSWPQYVNTLRPWQNGCNFAVDIFVVMFHDDNHSSYFCESCGSYHWFNPIAILRHSDVIVNHSCHGNRLWEWHLSVWQLPLSDIFHITSFYLWGSYVLLKIRKSKPDSRLQSAFNGFSKIDVHKFLFQ